MNFSETRGPIATKFYLKHHWVGRNAVISFGPDLIGTLVSVATDSSQRVIKGKCCEFIFDRIFFILTGNADNHNISDKFDFRPDLTKDCGVSCPWASGKIPIYLELEKSCEHSSSFIFDTIILILAGNEDMHKSLDEFKFRTDTTTNFRVICPCASEKLMYNAVNTLAPTFPSGSSSFLPITRTTIKSRTSSKFHQIQLWAAELAALERLEKSP